VATRPQAPGQAAKKPVEVVARERHLANPTTVRAAQVTFHCPARYAAEVRLTGERVEEPAPGRRVATGRARLTCRELTLEGEKITLRVRDDGTEDVQVTARGDVRFVTAQKDQVFREEGLKSLILTNDNVVPLR
jgi:hypothetical protein